MDYRVATYGATLCSAVHKHERMFLLHHMRHQTLDVNLAGHKSALAR